MRIWGKYMTIKLATALVGMLCLLGCQVQTGLQFKPEADSANDGHFHDTFAKREVGSRQDFEIWVSEDPSRRSDVDEYKNYLYRHLGIKELPMNELLTTARDWQACGYEPYEVPPKPLWGNIIPTLQVYHILKLRGTLPSDSQIRSVYRSPTLNQCAGGAKSSKHLVNGAIDIWVADSDTAGEKLLAIKDALCEFWVSEGARYQLGLGLYATGAIHLDTKGYRKWGTQFTNENSPCRE